MEQSLKKICDDMGKRDFNCGQAPRKLCKGLDIALSNSTDVRR